ncbi:MAG TPA: TIGR02757 family protein [Anaeromyxobacteraceae bacterium]|nr:TIGR02757 family protein [Anaeromyxobacteraceae bacterium]
MRRPPRTLSAARAAVLRPRLDALDAGTDRARRIGFDPVEFPRRYRDPGDQEVVGLVAASLAYGRADVFKPVLERVLTRMGPSPAGFADAFARAPGAAAFEGFLYRFNRPADVAALVAAVGDVRRRHGSLGARFAALFHAEGGAPGALRPALARFAGELRGAPPVGRLLAHRGPRGLLHLLPDPAGPGACKRWNLYLRWMVRGPDEVDLGAWRGVPASALVVPLDTHVLRIARCLGLTARRDATWRTAEEITAGLRRLDPADPVRYDFALCHLGMSGACPAPRPARRSRDRSEGKPARRPEDGSEGRPARRAPERCEECPLRGVCLAGRAAPRRRRSLKAAPSRREAAAPEAARTATAGRS